MELERELASAEQGVVAEAACGQTWLPILPWGREDDQCACNEKSNEKYTQGILQNPRLVYRPTGVGLARDVQICQ
jgi:hypothetical protein